MFSKKKQMLTAKAIHAQRSGDRNQDACIATQVITADLQFAIASKRQMNAKARNDEKHNYRGRAKYDCIPCMCQESAESGCCIHAGEQRKDCVVTNCNPESQHKPQSVQNRIVMQAFRRFLTVGSWQN